MSYQGNDPNLFQNKKLDSLTFNGSSTVFNLTSGGVAVYPATPESVIFSINGVIQAPTTAFTVTGSTITFSSAPANGAANFGIVLGNKVQLADALALSGGSMTGLLTLAGAPTASLHAATKAYVDTAVASAGTPSTTETLTNKTIALGSNTVSGTLAQFNAAVTDSDLASISGTETLTNKTLVDPNLTLSGTSGTSGQVLVSQGTGLPPVWGTTSADSGVTKLIGGGTLSAKLNAVMDAGAYSIPDLTTLSSSYAILAPNGITPPQSYSLSDGWTLDMPTSANQILAPYPVPCKHGIWPGATYKPQVDATFNSAASIDSISLSSDLHILRTLADTVVAFNSATNTFGTPVNHINTMTGKESGVRLHAVSATSFVVSGMADDGGTVGPYAQAFTVAGTTITAGSAVLLGGTSDLQTYQPPVQLNNTTFVYFYARSGTFDVAAKAFTVSGTTITAGTGVAIGTYSETAIAGALDITAAGKIDSSNLLVSYLTTGGGTDTSRAFASRVLSVSGTTITLRTAATSGGNINREEIKTLIAFSGTSFGAVVGNSATGSHNWFGITVSGTTTTIGTVQTRTTEDFESFTPSKTPYVVTGTNQAIMYAFDDTTPGRGSYVFGVTISNTTLTVGASLLILDPLISSNFGNYDIGVPFKRDAETGTVVFTKVRNVDDTPQIGKLSISGATVSIDYLLPDATWIYSETLNSSSVNIGGTWYTRSIPYLNSASPYVISPTRAIVYVSGTGLVALSNLNIF